MEENKIPETVENTGVDVNVNEEVSKKDAEINKLREMLSKANSEAAGYKKQLNAKMSAEELAKAKDNEEREALVNELNELKKDKQLSSLKAKFMGMGFGEEMAGKQANALFDGDIDSLFNNFKGFTEEVKNNAINDALKNNKKISDGDSNIQVSEVTPDVFKKMNYQERLKLLKEKPEVYKKLVD